MTRRDLYLAFGLAAYAVFAVTLAGAVLFLTGAGRAPLIDRPGSSPAAVAVAVDLALLGLFAIQHSVMARAGFKRRLLRIVPAGAERSVYVLSASLVLLLLFGAWRPLPAVLWSAPAPAAYAIAAVGWAGWVLVFAATWMIDHFDLFGLRQAWLAARARPYAPPAFTVRWLYAWVRHPMMSGFVLIFWAVPRMTLGHLLFSAAATGYVLVGTWLEERDLARAIPAYRDYQRRVGGLLPRARPVAG